MSRARHSVPRHVADSAASVRRRRPMASADAMPHRARQQPAAASASASAPSRSRSPAGAVPPSRLSALGSRVSNARFRNSSVFRVAVGIALAQAVGVPEPAHAAPGGGGGSVGTFADSTTVVCLASLLILFGVTFEQFEEHLKEHVSRNVKPIINSLFGELTLLGVIGLLLFVLEQSSLLDVVNDAAYGEGHPGHLLHLIHQVHMALFMVMVVFLSEVLLLVIMAVRLNGDWHHFETQSLDHRGIVHKASRYMHATPGWRCRAAAQAFCTCKGRTGGAAVHDEIVYAALRRRFIRPAPDNSASWVSKEPAPAVTSKKGEPLELRLSTANAEVYRKRITVRAFQSDAPIVVTKNWGQSEGHKGDWVIVGPDNDIYMCPDSVFQKSYQEVKGKVDTYRKIGTVLARKMEEAFVAIGEKGPQRGLRGSYLVQAMEKDGFQYTVSELDFKKTYEAVDSAAQVRHTDSLQLRADFDFSQYLSILLGETLAEVVEVKVSTWLVLQAVCLSFWGLLNLMSDNIDVFKSVSLAFGYILLVVGILQYRKLKWVRDQLVSPEILHAAQDMQAALTNSKKAKATSKVGVETPERTLPKAATTEKLEHAVSIEEKEAVSALATIPTHHSDETEFSSAIDLDNARSIPPYLLREPPKPRTGCAKRCLGRPGSRHEQLFWFDRHGPHFNIQMVQALMLCLSLYVSVAVLTVLVSCEGAGQCVPFTIVVLIPPLSLAVLLPNVIELLVVVSNVEGLKKRYTVMEVHRMQKTNRSMRALRLLTAMKVYATMQDKDAGEDDEVVGTGSATVVQDFKDDDELLAGAGGASSGGDQGALARPDSGKIALPPLGGGASGGEKYAADAKQSPDVEADAARLRDDSETRAAARRKQFDKRSVRRGSAFTGMARQAYGANSATYLRRKHELQEAFVLFDRDATGKVSAENVRAVLELVGLADQAASLASRIIQEIDVDNTGTIEFQELFDWMAAKEQSAAMRGADLTHAIFQLIDHDHSETITAGELRDTLSSLGEVMSHDDVQNIVREADGNGDGVIDVHEFAEMMKHSFEHSEFSL